MECVSSDRLCYLHAMILTDNAWCLPHTIISQNDLRDRSCELFDLPFSRLG